MTEHAFQFWSKFDFANMPIPEIAARATNALKHATRIKDQETIAALHQLNIELLTTLRQAWKKAPEPSRN